MEGQFLTDRGQIRSHNEDAGGIFLNENGQLLAIIADGMGGHQAGDVASKLAISKVETEWQESTLLNTPDEVGKWLQRTLDIVNEYIYQYAQKQADCQGMGTTIVVAICTNNFVTIGHIGDSRCYMYNNFGFKQVTEDHSLVNELVRYGEISMDDAELHPRKNVLLKALGTEKKVQPDVQTMEWDPGDQLLLCSDGLTNKLADNELVAFLAENSGLEKIGAEMIALANRRGGEDNISVALIKHFEKAGEPEC